MPGVQIIQDNSLDNTMDIFRAAGGLANAVTDARQQQMMQEMKQRELQAKKERDEARKVFAQRMEQSSKVFSNPNATLEERMAAYQPVVDYQTKTGEDVSKQYGIYADDLKARMEGREKRQFEDYKLQGDIYQQDRKFAQEQGAAREERSFKRGLAVEEANLKRELAKLERDDKKGTAVAKTTDDLRKEFTNLDVYKNTEKTHGSYKNIITSLAKETGPGDMSSIFAFFKTIDPSSTVREGEYKSAMVARGVQDRITGYLQKLKNGEFLTPQDRENFAQIATDMYKEQHNLYEKAKSGYSKIAEKRGVDTSDVFPSDFAPPKSAREALTAARGEAQKNQPLKYISPADQKELQARPEVQERIKKFAIANADKLNSMDENQRAEVMRNLFEKIVRTQGFTIKTENVAGN